MGRVATVGYSTPHHNWWFVLACLLGHTLHHVRTRTRLRARGRIIWFTVRTRRRPAFTFALIGISNKSGWLLNYSIHLYLNYSQCWFFLYYLWLFVFILSVIIWLLNRSSYLIFCLNIVYFAMTYFCHYRYFNYMTHLLYIKNCIRRRSNMMAKS
jgi:hypothetical protein